LAGKYPRATPHNNNCGALRKFFARNALHQLEIHKVFLRCCAFSWRKIISQIALVPLCGLAQSYKIRAFFPPDAKNLRLALAGKGMI
jgi:hypothetical protein